MKQWRGKVAVITGAGSGIGRALALACAAEGMRLALLDLRAEPLEQTAALAGGESMIRICDVADEAAVEGAAAAVFERYGAVHLLFNNAGIFGGGPLWRAPTAEWRRVFDVNVMGVVHGLRSFVPRMLDQNQAAHIVNTASVGGLTSPPHYGTYSASKHAVVSLSECLHHDLREVTDRIGVSVLCPAAVKTAIADETGAENESPGATAHRAATRALMDEGRLSVDDIARITLDGIQRGLFYILPHRGSRLAVEWRLQDILQDRQPTNPMRGPGA